MKAVKGCVVMVLLAVIFWVAVGVIGWKMPLQSRFDAPAPKVAEEPRKAEEKAIAHADSVALQKRQQDEAIVKEFADYAKANPITAEKFRKIETGMTYDQVFRILGVHGEELSRVAIAGEETVLLSWANQNASNMTVTFQNAKVAAKAQFGLRDWQPTQEQQEAAQRLAKAAAAEAKEKWEADAPIRAQVAKEAREEREQERQAQEEAKRKAALRKAEERAASNIRYAKKLADSGMVERAKERLREIIKEYPETESAKEAKALFSTNWASDEALVAALGKLSAADRARLAALLLGQPAEQGERNA